MIENPELPFNDPVDRAAATPPLQGGQAPLNTRVGEHHVYNRRRYDCHVWGGYLCLCP